MRYRKVLELLGTSSSKERCWADERRKRKAEEIQALCHLNLAAIALKEKDFNEAKSRCGKALEFKEANSSGRSGVMEDKEELAAAKEAARTREAKARFRLAQAEFGLQDYPAAMVECKKVLEVDPGNKEARNLYQEASRIRKEEEKRQKSATQGFFGNMAKGLGKLGGEERTTAAAVESQAKPGGGGGRGTRRVDLAAP